MPLLIEEFSISRDRLSDPAMTLKDNPLANGPQRNAIVERNMDRLMEDAHLRKGVHGAVYAGIMDMRLER